MSQNCVLTPVAFIHTEFPAKFGIPRQAGLAEELRGKIVFEPAFRVDEALRANFPSLLRHEVYCCGSPGMVNAVRSASEQLGLAHEHFFSDSFVPGPAA